MEETNAEDARRASGRGGFVWGRALPRNVLTIVQAPRDTTEQVASRTTVVTEVSPKHVLLREEVNITNDSKCRPFRTLSNPNPRQFASCPVKTNHFDVTFDVNNFPKSIYHYDVVITQQEGRERTKRGPLPGEEINETTVPARVLHAIWREFEERFHSQLGARMPFDGKKNCFTARPLNLGNNAVWSDDITMVNPDDADKERSYRVRLKFANEINTGIMFTYMRTCDTMNYCELPQKVIQALDVALRYSPAIRFTPYNGGFFTNQYAHRISGLLELWFGHNQSLMLGRDQQATLNIDMANKAFLKRLPVEKVMKTLLNKTDEDMSLNYWSPSNYWDADNFLEGKLIEYGTGRCVNGVFEKYHRFVVVAVKECTAESFYFEMKGLRLNIAEYFEREKGMKLKHKDWPVIHIGDPNRTNFVPLELCNIVPQAYKGKLDAQDALEMIKGAAKPPAERFQRIERARYDSKFEQCSILKEFGLQVGTQLVEIPTSKKLPMPDLHIRTERGKEEFFELKGNDGNFEINQFLVGAVVPKIGVLNVCGNLTDTYKGVVKKDFLGRLGAEALRLGMVSESGEPVDRLFKNAEYFAVKARIIRGGAVREDSFHQATSEALKSFKMKGYGLVIVIMGRDGNEYATVKNEAEVQVGILTQCVKETTVQKITKGAGKQIMMNMLLKVNAKLNGINYKLGRRFNEGFDFEQEPTLILGAGFSHRAHAPNSKSPSVRVAAITASYDISGVCFQMHIKVQEAAEEVIKGLKEIVGKMLRGFREKTGKAPKRIIMFRDGASDDQFPIIKETEYQGIVEACIAIEDTYKPKITFLVVKKRHHTRFLPMNTADAVLPKFNIPPGTVVDSRITHPTEIEYFLNSHVGIQGTSKPALYHVIHDDSHFSVDDLELLSYWLCYTFVRCAQPVSYPAPTYYAHLAAFRAQALLEKEGDNADLKALQERMTIHPDLVKNYPMFYV